MHVSEGTAKAKPCIKELIQQASKYISILVVFHTSSWKTNLFK